MDKTLYNASGCMDKTAHDAICLAEKPKPKTDVFRTGYTEKDVEADIFIKAVKKMAKGCGFKLCDRIRFEDLKKGKKYL